MSMLITLTEAATLAASDDDIIGFTGDKLTAVADLFRLGGWVAGIGFVLFQAIVSRGAMARIIISGLAAGIFIWIVNNVTTVEDHVDGELNGAPALVVVAR